MSAWRIILVLMLAVLLPARVVVAAALPCLPTAGQGSPVFAGAAPVGVSDAMGMGALNDASGQSAHSAHGGHGGHGSHGGRALHSQPPGHEHASVVSAHSADTDSSAHGEGQCLHCVAGCCLLPALSGGFSLPPAPIAATILPRPILPPLHHLADGQERPPRRL